MTCRGMFVNHLNSKSLISHNGINLYTIYCLGYVVSRTISSKVYFKRKVTSLVHIRYLELRRPLLQIK